MKHLHTIESLSNYPGSHEAPVILHVLQGDISPHPESLEGFYFSYKEDLDKEKYLPMFRKNIEKYIHDIQHGAVDINQRNIPHDFEYMILTLVSFQEKFGRMEFEVRVDIFGEPNVQFENIHEDDGVVYGPERNYTPNQLTTYQLKFISLFDFNSQLLCSRYTSSHIDSQQTKVLQ